MPFRQRVRHSFAHLWPRIAAAYVRDLWIRLPATPADGRRIAALTFDDGPTDAGTPQLLERLERHNIRATFFLSGESILRFPHRAREIAAAGHALGNHFRRHVDCWKTPPRSVIREAFEGNRIIEDVTGISPGWCRPPYGRLTHAIVKWSRIHQQPIVLWDAFPPDSLPSTTTEDLARVLLRRLGPRSIVCLHDNPVALGKTARMLEQVLPQLLRRQWSFVTLPRLKSWGSSEDSLPARAA